MKQFKQSILIQLAEPVSVVLFLFFFLVLSQLVFLLVVFLPLVFFLPLVYFLAALLGAAAAAG